MNSGKNKNNKNKNKNKIDPWEDEDYFKSYADVGIHEDMLRDEIRTETYRKAMMAYDFTNKIVLDVGCGTGVLSIFAARAGASKVYAVDASDISNYAKKIIKDNNLDSVITVIQGKIEDIELDSKVDIIVSEWMGYFLLYESMFSSVIYARDKWLKPDGLLFPSRANMYMAMFRDDGTWNERVDFWKNVYDIDMSAMKPLAIKNAFNEVIIDYLPEEYIISNPNLILSFDCKTCSPRDAEAVNCIFSLKSQVSDKLGGFVIWFDVEFENDIVLSTRPGWNTHWFQTICPISKLESIEQDSKVSGFIRMAPPSELKRHIDIDITYSTNSNEEKGLHFEY